MTQKRKPTVLFFDSGMGGLSVFTEAWKLNRDAAFYYLFDHECFPYGNKSEVFLRRRVSALLKAVSDELHPDLIVIACNTASTTVMPVIRDIFSIPVVGVVPAIKPAAAISRNKHIALLATPGTVHRAYTDFLINEFAYDCRVMRIGSEDLVRLAEAELLKFGRRFCAEHLADLENAHGRHSCMLENEHLHIADDDSTNHQRLEKILEPVLSLPQGDRPDTLILGCTHFPLLRDDIAQVLGPDITLVDSGEAVARRINSLLAGQQESSGAAGAAAGGAVESGPQVAMYTGNATDQEKDMFECTFRCFGFVEVRNFILKDAGTVA